MIIYLHTVEIMIWWHNRIVSKTTVKYSATVLIFISIYGFISVLLPLSRITLWTIHEVDDYIISHQTASPPPSLSCHHWARPGVVEGKYPEGSWQPQRARAIVWLHLILLRCHILMISLGTGDSTTMYNIKNHLKVQQFPCKHRDIFKSLED